MRLGYSRIEDLLYIRFILKIISLRNGLFWRLDFVNKVFKYNFIEKINKRGGNDMKGYENPNMPKTLGLGACFITPMKAAVTAYWCVYSVAAVV